MGRKERKGRKEREMAMKKIMMGIGLVAVAVLGCSRENLKNKDDEKGQSIVAYTRPNVDAFRALA